MRKGFSPTKSKLENEMSLRKDQNYNNIKNLSAKDYRYLCHYNNAIYMGAMNSYKKHGKGILLHDDGAAAITEYINDIPSGHTIVFRQNSISSIIVNSSTSYQIAYKVGRTIIKIPFNDNINKAHGIGVLIDYVQNKIFELIFKNGDLTEKILNLDHKSHDDVFMKKSIASIIGLRHEQAFQLTFETPGNIAVQFKNNKLIIGYSDENGEIHGLAFKIYAQNMKASGQKSLYMKSLERGYYKHSILQTFGQKYFSNGNKYVGQFENGQFNGRGILLCPAQMKWVYGKFKANKLMEVLDSNNKKYTENSFHVWTQSLREIHKGHRERWIDLDIELPQEFYLYTILQDALKRGMTYVSPDHEEKDKEDEKNLQRIQGQFQQGHPGNSALSFVDNELDKHYTVKSNKSSRLSDQKPITKGQLIRDLFERQQPLYTSNKPKDKHSRILESPLEQNNYRMEDPFKIELIKVPSQQTPKNTSFQKDSQPVYNFDYREKYFPRQFAQSFSRRYPMRYPLLNNENKYNSHHPIDESYNKTYLQALQRQRQKLKHRVEQDERYIDQLQSQLSQSPRHGNYSSPPKYESPSQRNIGKISKKSFNQENPYDRNFPKDFEDPDSSNFEYQPLYTKDKQPTTKRSRRPEERESPFKNNSYNTQKSPKNNFLQNNYKYWS